MHRTALLAALSLLAAATSGCVAGASAEASFEAESGGEAPAIVVPEAAIDIVPRDMHLLVHVDAEALRGSGIMGILVNEAREQEDVDEADLAAIDYFAAQSDAVLCAIRYDARTEGARYVCVLSGRFAGWSMLATLAGLEGEVLRDPHGFAVLEAGDAATQSPTIVVLDDRHILATDPALLGDVYRAMMDPTARVSAQDGFTPLAQAGGFGAHAASLLGMLPEPLREELASADGGDAGAVFLDQVAQRLNGVTARVDIADLTELTVGLHVQAPQDAADLANLARMTLQIASRTEEDEELGAWLGRIQVGAEDAQVTLRLAAPTDEVLARLADVADKAAEGTRGAAPETAASP